MAGSLTELMVLNQEILAIARARAPISAELLRAARQMPGAGAKLAQRIAERLQAGATLEQALVDQHPKVPHFYTAVVVAGQQSGRLPQALERVGVALQRMDVTRRQGVLALAYPLAIAATAWVLLVVAARYLAPTLEWIELSRKPLLSHLHAEGARFWVLLASVPAALLTLLLLQRFTRRRNARAVSTGAWLIDRLPGVAHIRRLNAYATFADILSLLVEHQTPLPKALRLAGDAVQWAPVTTPAHRLAQEVADGQPLSADHEGLTLLPPLVRVSLLSAAAPESISHCVRYAAVEYHRRATASLANLAVVLPAMLTATIGGAAVGGYALLVLAPYYTALWELAF